MPWIWMVPTFGQRSRPRWLAFRKLAHASAWSGGPAGSPGLPRILQRARCMISKLHRHSKLVRPWVQTTVSRAMWNGRSTDRGCQRDAPCVFKCGGAFSKDSLEHIVCCHFPLDFAVTRLRIAESEIRDLDTWFFTREFEWDDAIVRLAVLQHADYKLRTHCVHSVSPPFPSFCRSFLSHEVYPWPSTYASSFVTSVPHAVGFDCLVRIASGVFEVR